MISGVRHTVYNKNTFTARMKTKMVTMIEWMRSHLNWLYYVSIHIYRVVAYRVWQLSFELYIVQICAHAYMFTHTNNTRTLTEKEMARDRNNTSDSYTRTHKRQIPFKSIYQTVYNPLWLCPSYFFLSLSLRFSTLKLWMRNLPKMTWAHCQWPNFFLFHRIPGWYFKYKFKSNWKFYVNSQTIPYLVLSFLLLRNIGHWIRILLKLFNIIITFLNEI